MAWSICGDRCPECGHCCAAADLWDDRHAVLTCVRCGRQRLEQVVGRDVAAEPVGHGRSRSTAIP
jgi:hypothetical protein